MKKRLKESMNLNRIFRLSEKPKSKSRISKLQNLKKNTKQLLLETITSEFQRKSFKIQSRKSTRNSKSAQRRTPTNPKRPNQLLRGKRIRLGQGTLSRRSKGMSEEEGKRKLRKKMLRRRRGQ
jgi:hypothetical protein